MKNKITRFAIILTACIIIYGVTLIVPFGKHVDLADFIKGFAIGIGCVAAPALVVFMVKKAREESIARS